MCFSAGASFTGGVVITAIGIITIRKVHKPTQILFACIPLFFGLQQLAEGFVWLSLQYPGFGGIQKPATYVFLMMAEIFWPFMTPLAILMMEKNKKRIKALRVFLAMGLSVSVYFVFCLVMFVVTPEIKGFHIEYVEKFPQFLRLFVFSIYLIATITPFFISTIKRTYILGILMAMSCVVTIVFFTQYLTSVWCFFGALLSIVILWILSDERKKYNLGREEFTPKMGA